MNTHNCYIVVTREGIYAIMEMFSLEGDQLLPYPPVSLTHSPTHSLVPYLYLALPTPLSLQLSLYSPWLSPSSKGSLGAGGRECVVNMNAEVSISHFGSCAGEGTVAQDQMEPPCPREDCCTSQGGRKKIRE